MIDSDVLHQDTKLAIGCSMLGFLKQDFYNRIFTTGFLQLDFYNRIFTTGFLQQDFRQLEVI